jgi:uncharacterized protein with HEPN domain
MPKRDLIVRLEDIRTMIASIESIMASACDEASLCNSEVHKLALERAFEIIGEALYQIQKEHADAWVTDVSKIVSLRHLLAHDYFKVKHELLWQFGEEKIPALKREVMDWIDRENLRLFGTTQPKID